MIDHVQDSRLNELSLHYRSDDFDQGFPGKDHRTLRNRVNISREVKAPEILQKIIFKNAETPQIIYVVRRKVKIPDIFNDLLQACRDGVGSVTGIFAVKSVEDHGLIRGIFKITLHHGQLIEICQQGQILCSHGSPPKK